MTVLPPNLTCASQIISANIRAGYLPIRFHFTIMGIYKKRISNFTQKMIDIIGTGLSDMSKVIIKAKLLHIMNLLPNLHPIFTWKLLFFIDNYSSSSL